jgi:hypothetical protein
MERVVQRSLRAWPRAQNGSEEQDVYLDSVALNLHRLTLADIEAAKEYYRENKQEIDYDIYNHSQRWQIIEKLV